MGGVIRYTRKEYLTLCNNGCFFSQTGIICYPHCLEGTEIQAIFLGKNLSTSSNASDPIWTVACWAIPFGGYEKHSIWICSIKADPAQWINRIWRQSLLLQCAGHLLIRLSSVRVLSSYPPSLLPLYWSTCAVCWVGGISTVYQPGYPPFAWRIFRCAYTPTISYTR